MTGRKCPVGQQIGSVSAFQLGERHHHGTADTYIRCQRRGAGAALRNRLDGSRPHLGKRNDPDTEWHLRRTGRWIQPRHDQVRRCGRTLVDRHGNLHLPGQNVLQALRNGSAGRSRRRSSGWVTILGVGGHIDHLGVRTRPGQSTRIAGCRRTGRDHPKPCRASSAYDNRHQWRLGANGFSWRVLEGPDVHSEFDAAQYRALQHLAQTDDGLQTSSPHDHLELSTASATIWTVLEDVVSAGVPLITDSSSPADRVEIAKRAVLGLDIGPGDTTAAASLDARLLVDDEPWDLTHAYMLGKPSPHGVFHVEDRVLTLAPFEPLPPKSLLDLAGSKLSAQIPVTDADHFMNDVLPRLQASVPVRVADRLFEPPEITGPTPVLTVSTTDVGVRARWTIRYHVNGDQRDVDPTAQGPFLLPRQSAEDDVWQQNIGILGAVARSADSWQEPVQPHRYVRCSPASNCPGWKPHVFTSRCCHRSSTATTSSSSCPMNQRTIDSKPESPAKA